MNRTQNGADERPQPPRRVEHQRALKERLTEIEQRLGRIELYLEYLVGKAGVVMSDLPPFLREDEICRDTKVGYAGILPMSQGAFRSAVKAGRIAKPDTVDGIQVWRREDILRARLRQIG